MALHVQYTFLRALYIISAKKNKVKWPICKIFGEGEYVMVTIVELIS